jgi:hypothetical protein
MARIIDAAPRHACGTIAAMTTRLAAPRWAFWALVFALLLKGAVPLLAAASAQVQGRTLVEVCTVYGVATVDLGAEDHDDAPIAAHAGGACVLATVVAFAVPAAGATALMSPSSRDGGPAVVPDAARIVAPDADAAWAARLRHGPPVLA